MLKKLGIIVATCAISLLFAITANADTVSLGKVTTDSLNVRSAPSSSSTSLGRIPYNYEVTILSSSNGWYKILYGSQKAYVHSDYVKIIKTNVQRDVSVYSGNALPSLNDIIPSYEGSNVPGEKLVEFAKQYVGTPYAYGSASPETGFDCSGFVQFCYTNMGSSVSRMTHQQVNNGVEVPASSMRPGDIICFSANEGGSGSITHTGIYVGNRHFIHAPKTGYKVEIISLDISYYKNRIASVRRIFN